MSAGAGTMAAASGATTPNYVRLEDGVTTQLATITALGGLKVSLADPASGNQAAISAVGAVSVAASGDTATDADALAVRSIANVAQSIGLGYGFNGTTYDRGRTVSAVGDGLGVRLAMQPSSTYGANTGTNVQATVTFAGVAGQQHRITQAKTSYTGTVGSATNGQLLDNGATVFQWLGSVAPFSANLPPGGIKQIAVNTAVSSVLGAGGLAAVSNVFMAKVTA